MGYYKQRAPTREAYEKGEFKYNIVASLLGGIIGSALTNSFEVLAINKQAHPECKLLALIKREKFKLLTKGLGARVFYLSFQSMLFFSCILYFGKLYHVDLTEAS